MEYLLRATDNGRLVLRGDAVVVAPDGHAWGWRESAEVYHARFGTLDGFASDYVVVQGVPDKLAVDLSERLADGRHRRYVDLTSAALAGLHTVGNVYRVPDGYTAEDVAQFVGERS